MYAPIAMSLHRRARMHAIPLSQVMYSAASASLPLCIILADLHQDQQTRLLAMQLAGVLSGALVRSAFLEPALALGRGNRQPVPRLPLYLFPLLGTLASSIVVASLTGWASLFLAPALAAILIGDSLRYGLWSTERLRPTVLADAALLAGSAVVALLLAGHIATLRVSAILLAATYATWLAILVCAGCTISMTTKPINTRTAIALGRYQTVDQALGLAALQVPTVLFAGTPAQFAAFRLAQSLLGPLNTLQQALGTRMLTAKRKDNELPPLRLPVGLSAVSLIYTLIVGLVILPLMGTQALLPFTVLGIAMVCTAASGPFVYSLRANLQQRTSLVVRAIVTSLAVAVPLLAWIILSQTSIAAWTWTVILSVTSLIAWPVVARWRLAGR